MHFFPTFRFWETDVSASFGLTVTDETKFGEQKLTVNRHKPLILLIKFMASLTVPLLVRCKPFLPRHSLPILLLSTIWSLREFKSLFKFSTVRDALPSSVLLITLEIIIWHYGREIWMKVLRLRILSSTTREDSLTQLFVSTCKIIVSGHFCNKGRK